MLRQHRGCEQARLGLTRGPRPPEAEQRQVCHFHLAGDETDVANLVVWLNAFEKNRRTVLGASMLGVSGQMQREGDVIHIVAQRLNDLSGLLASVGRRGDVADIYPVSRGRRGQ